ncbi:unnamed protein product [Brassica rapa]|uniref:Uncharacterized protein n=2 Tax=Brassica TaxID=3705 RepID=A0A8D9G6A0_BRACM|nr:unnamed protein product [Brassica napus]CAG7869669.1 unnamed protein product [Brassica rapa]
MEMDDNRPRWSVEGTLRRWGRRLPKLQRRRDALPKHMAALFPFNGRSLPERFFTARPLVT